MTFGSALKAAMHWIRSRYAKWRYYCYIYLDRPNKVVVDDYFRYHPDPYKIARNGDERFEAIVDALCMIGVSPASIADISCHEGYAVHYISERLDINYIVGLDISGCALSRARSRLIDKDILLAEFDLSELFCNRAEVLPIPFAVDIVLVCEVLYYIGPNAHNIWGSIELDFNKKVEFIKKIQTHARQGVILQHFGIRERASIDKVARECGGRLLNKKWGIYYIKGLANNCIISHEP